MILLYRLIPKLLPSVSIETVLCAGYKKTEILIEFYGGIWASQLRHCVTMVLIFEYFFINKR